LQQEILQYVEISVFGRISGTAPEYDRILRGGSKVPHRWIVDRTQVGPMSQNNFFSHQIFSHFLNLNLTDFLYVVEGEMIVIHAKFSRFAKICDL